MTPTRFLACAGAALTASAALLASGAAAQETGRPELMNRLTACRDTAEPAARLACYDAAVEALDAAERQGDLAVIDRAQVRESRRALFGFELPSLPAFSRVTEGEEALSSVDTTLERASRGAEGRWVFRLADGSVWRQSDSESVNFQNRPGAEVRVRRAMLGSYMLTVGGSRAVRVRREQ